MFWTPNGLNELPEVRFEFPFNLIGAMSSPGHKIQSFFTTYLVLHFPEVWKCGVVRQSKEIVSLSPSHEPFVILYLVLHFPEVWKGVNVQQSKDIVSLSSSHEPFVILYLVLHFPEVWKCRKV